MNYPVLAHFLGAGHESWTQRPGGATEDLCADGPIKMNHLWGILDLILSLLPPFDQAGRHQEEGR